MLVTVILIIEGCLVFLKMNTRRDNMKIKNSDILSTKPIYIVSTIPREKKDISIYTGKDLKEELKEELRSELKIY